MIVEICANSFKSAGIAQEGGADRIELCENLSVGGLTPSQDLIKRVLTELVIETHVLIRPRSGDFVYSEEELKQMISDIEFCKAIGCAGVVSGALNLNEEIDLAATERLINAAEGMHFTFHRAFDVCRNPENMLSELVMLGVDRLLSSGLEHKAVDGLPLLKTLLNQSEGKIEIMPGSGISSANVLQFKEAGFQGVHLSAIKKYAKATSDSLFNNTVEGHSDLSEIKTVIQLLS